MKRVIVAIIVFFLLTAFFLYKFTNKSPTTYNLSLTTFAKCLTEKGLVMYGAYWCPHCKDQKAAFGDAFEYINYVECTTAPQLCTDKGVTGYPTWIASDSAKLEGFQSLEKLSQITGCQL